MRRFHRGLRRHVHADRVERDIASADRSGVAGTPAFFFNGRRHHGAHDLGTLTTLARSRVSSMPRARDPGTLAVGRCPMTGSASFAWPRGGTGLAGPVTSRARTAQAAGPRLPSAPGRRPTASGLPATRGREG
ncbi:sodium:proton antiporter [Streptomyces sp. NPDC005388]|uniref:DsbA family protein n=1 Tax=Streptomyces sp. NPDC005388 TaxID=3156717 RepID=UPI0033AB3756